MAIPEDPRGVSRLARRGRAERAPDLRGDEPRLHVLGPVYSIARRGHARTPPRLATARDRYDLLPRHIGSKGWAEVPREPGVSPVRRRPASLPTVRVASWTSSVSFVTALLACSGWNGVLHVDLVGLENPDSGRVVRIASVRDLRTFRRHVRDPSLPSLYRDLPLEPEWTGRALGRRRETRGGNLLTPEGTTVADWVAEALTVALREQGVRVVEAEAPEVLPLDVEILELWSWVTSKPFGPPRFRFRGRLRVTAPDLPYYGGPEYRSDRVRSSGGPSRAIWTATVRAGLLDLSRRAAKPWQPAPSAIDP